MGSRDSLALGSRPNIRDFVKLTPQRIRAGTWVAVLALVLVFVTWDNVSRSGHILGISDAYGVTVDPPALDPNSPTGYASGRRSMILPQGAADTAHWIMQTQSMIAAGDWRVRHVDYDHAPEGREVHWAAPFHWWLAGLAWADHLISGRPIGVSVERATLWAGPLMFGLFLIALIPFLSRRFSRTAAAVIAISLVATYSFYIDFRAGRADHHGIANICGLLTVLFLLTGCLADEKRRVRSWFVASAVAGGTGLWISAATQVPVLIGVGLGILGASWLGRKTPERVAWLVDPAVLRLWGLVGGGVSLAAYLIEYFPHHLGWRLEVNHPLYAIAWMGAGEVLRVSTVATRRGLRALERRDVVNGTVAVLAVLALPITILLFTAEVFVVADPFVWKIHNLYIGEFQTVARVISVQGWTGTKMTSVLPVLLLVLPVASLFRKQTPPEGKALLAVALAPALIGWMLGSDQIRWLGLALALTVPVVALHLRMVKNRTVSVPGSPILWAIVCALVFVPGTVSAVRRAILSGEPDLEDVQSLAARDVAHWLRIRTNGAPTVVAAPPGTTSKLIYFGGLSGLGTLYWENAGGLRVSAEFFGAPTAAAAHDLAERLGVTHIVLISWDAFELDLAKAYRGVDPRGPTPGDTLAANLLGGLIPPLWLRGLPFVLPEHEDLTDERVRIWEVTDVQTPLEATVHAANYYLEMGMLDRTTPMARLLAGFRDDLIANVMLAGIASVRGDQASFSTILDRVVAQLSQADGLALDERIHLAGILAMGDRLELAREQVQACGREANDGALRKLTVGELTDFLALIDGFGLSLLDTQLERMAKEMLPSSRRN